MLPDAYFAGFLDGEGNIGIARASAARRRHLVLYVYVTNTNREVLDLFVERFGGSVIPEKKRERHKQSWRYRSDAKQAENMLRALLPYLVVKRERAEVALAFRALYGGANRLPSGVQYDAPGAAEKRARIMSAREECRERILVLNRRGDAVVAA